MKTRPPLHQSSFGILLCFFFSGAAGLIYQVAWGKALGLTFGHTVYAISTVLAVFMGGLAAGSAYLGRWGELHRRPLSLYARLEFLIAATGALSLVGLSGVRWLYLAAYPAVGGLEPFLIALRFFGAGLVLLIPTFLMGGTFPILVRGLAQHSVELGTRVSLLYWVNTLGAVAGTLIAGFGLLPAFGLRMTIASAVVLNILAGLIALRVARDGRITTDGKGLHARLIPRTGDVPQRASTFLFFLFAVVGSTAFAYEIAWTGLLSNNIGS